MPTRKHHVLKGLATVMGVLATFVVVSLLARQYEEAIGGFIRAGGVAGPIAFILISAVCLALLIPLDVSVLIPLAIVSWGPLATALMTVVGWTLGSTASFYLARRFGRPLAERLVGRERVLGAELHAPKHHLFWWVLGAQALVQVDFISYLFGLFTEVELGTYVLATLLGDLAPAFFFAYVGGLPVWYELAALAAGVALTGFFFWRFTKMLR